MPTPLLTLPDWVSESHLTIENDAGQQVFAGPAAQYDGFLYPANGGYKAQLTLWRLAPGQDKAQFDPEAQAPCGPTPAWSAPPAPRAGISTYSVFPSRPAPCWNCLPSGWIRAV